MSSDADDPDAQEDPEDATMMTNEVSHRYFTWFVVAPLLHYISAALCTATVQIQM